jgi:hypothetical protein
LSGPATTALRAPRIRAYAFFLARVNGRTFEG